MAGGEKGTVKMRVVAAELRLDPEREPPSAEWKFFAAP